MNRLCFNQFVIPERFFPFKQPEFSFALGLQPVGPGDTLFERDDLFDEHLAVKRKCLENDFNYYFQIPPQAVAAASEAVALINRKMRLEAGSDSQVPAFLNAGLRIQEDLILVGRQGPLPLLGGLLCFANAWCLDEKIGRGLMEVHEPVPGFATQLGAASQRFLERMKPARSAWRVNWGLTPLGQMDLSSRWNEARVQAAANITPQTAGQHCHLRVERQTFTLLEAADAVLFTIHTYQQPVETLSGAQQHLLLHVLRSTPGDVLDYKGISRFARPLFTYLDRTA